MTWAKSLADAASLLEHLVDRRRHRRRVGIELELAVDAAHQIGDGVEPVAAGSEARRRRRRARRRTTARARSARPCGRHAGRPGPARRGAIRAPLPRPAPVARSRSGRSETSTSHSMRTRSTGCGPCTPKWVTPLSNESRASRGARRARARSRARARRRAARAAGTASGARAATTAKPGCDTSSACRARRCSSRSSARSRAAEPGRSCRLLP